MKAKQNVQSFSALFKAWVAVLLRKKTIRFCPIIVSKLEETNN